MNVIYRDNETGQFSTVGPQVGEPCTRFVELSDEHSVSVGILELAKKIAADHGRAGVDKLLGDLIFEIQTAEADADYERSL